MADPLLNCDEPYWQYLREAVIGLLPDTVRVEEFVDSLRVTGRDVGSVRVLVAPMAPKSWIALAAATDWLLGSSGLSRILGTTRKRSACLTRASTTASRLSRYRRPRTTAVTWAESSPTTVATLSSISATPVRFP